LEPIWLHQPAESFFENHIHEYECAERLSTYRDEIAVRQPKTYSIAVAQPLTSTSGSATTDIDGSP
jgi:hypothetical protein